MRQICIPALIVVGAFAAYAAERPPSVILNLEKSPHAKLRNVPVSAVKISEGLWAERRKINVEKSIPTLLELLEQNGIVDNFRRLSGRKDVPRRGPLYTDSDLYKWMEAVAFVLQSEDRPDLRANFDRLTDEILAAQEPSGYLNTWYVEDRKALRWKEQERGHELYCLGHMLQAAIAYYRATGNRKLLDGGIKFVDYLLRDFGPDKQPLLAGHPEIELALVELYRVTGNRQHLDLAGYILRGDGERLKLRPQQLVYMFSGKPFTQRTIMEGHAVRAAYATSGATDYYIETGDAEYRRTLNRLWNDMVTSKMYITGGIGSRAAGEAFGDPYELPNARAYTESCAAIANLMWNWRMLAAAGEAKYADVIELALHNSINSGMSLEGTLYCYRNPLELTAEAAKGIRNPWYSTTCCPPNLERTFASLPGLYYSTSRDGLYVHLYGPNEMNWKLEDGTPLKVKQDTRYPWDGTVDLTVNPAAAKEFTIHVRIPEWAEAAEVQVGGRRIAGPVKAGEYIPIKRRWAPGDTVRIALDMKPRAIKSHPRVVDNQGRVAIMRGPIVYALEQHDQPAGVDVFDTFFKLSADPAKDFTAEFRKDLLGGVVVLRHRGLSATRPASGLSLYEPVQSFDYKGGKPADLVLIPYYTFLNRGPAAMQVWTLYQK
ncbi:MAG: glycoside hydrolase family 127 protein [Planctomycetes bacterium]|nr:glycoside hydrolase family 127 protein [Planctomycetota bacterium]